MIIFQANKGSEVSQLKMAIKCFSELDTPSIKLNSSHLYMKKLDVENLVAMSL
jgi:hypothetical protein